MRLLKRLFQCTVVTQYVCSNLSCVYKAPEDALPSLYLGVSVDTSKLTPEPCSDHDPVVTSKPETEAANAAAGTSPHNALSALVCLTV